MVGHSHSTSDLCNEFFNMNLTQLVSEQTHIHGNILQQMPVREFQTLYLIHAPVEFTQTIFSSSLI